MKAEVWTLHQPQYQRSLFVKATCNNLKSITGSNQSPFSPKLFKGSLLSWA